MGTQSVSIFDGTAMKQRLCPYAGQSTRQRVIHVHGRAMVGTLSNRRQEQRKIVARFGPALPDGSGPLYGWGITFKDRGDPMYLENTVPVKDEVVQGDLLVLGLGNRYNSTYTNDTRLLTLDSIRSVGIVSITETAFSRTGKNGTFARVPYKFFEVSPETRVILRNAQPTSKKFDASVRSQWNIHRIDNESIIGCLDLDEWDGETTGDELVFDHDLEEKPVGCFVQTPIGLCFYSTVRFVSGLTGYIRTRIVQVFRSRTRSPVAPHNGDPV
jgi:hypothetical protein